MIKINSIEIKGVGPIKDLKLAFDPNFNIICGQNGIGKTTILDCISQSFSLNGTVLKKTVGFEKGEWNIDMTINDDKLIKQYNLTAFHPNEADTHYNETYHQANAIIVFKTHRDIPYKRLDNISSDKNKEITTFARETISGSLSDDLKNWFANRYLFSAQPGSLEENQIKNYELAKECFSILNPELSFSKISPNTFDILLLTPAGEIYFEYLSSGYKSCLAVLLGLINEIELRYKNPSIFIKNFEGIVIIDELDLHLHPDWQAKIYEALKVILPKAQIFTSTHSPHIIQIAKPNEIIALIFDDSNKISINPIENTEYGFQGWSVEEILKDVMGMEETRTETYRNAIYNFNKSIDTEKFNDAKYFFDIIDKMLHPDNSLRKILKIQLTGNSVDDQNK